MSATVVMPRFGDASPRFNGSVAGVFYLLVFVMGGFALALGGRFVVAGDAAATAANILAHESLYRLGWASNMIATVCYIAVTGLFYGLFKPVNRSLSLLAALFGLAGCTSSGVGSLFNLAPLFVLKGAKSLAVFNAEQLQTLAYLFLKLNELGANISFVFFGCYCLLIGALILKSTFLPRPLGVLMVCAGLGWLTSSFASFLSPPLASHLFPYIFAPGIIGEGALTLWLLVAGVNVQRWREQANVGSPS